MCLETEFFSKLGFFLAQFCRIKRVDNERGRTPRAPPLKAPAGATGNGIQMPLTGFYLLLKQALNIQS